MVPSIVLYCVNHVEANTNANKHQGNGEKLSVIALRHQVAVSDGGYRGSGEVNRILPGPAFNEMEDQCRDQVNPCKQEPCVHDSLFHVRLFQVDLLLVMRFKVNS